MSENKSKRYFWNSNAETHANAVFAMFVLSVGVAGIVAMLVGTAVFLFGDIGKYDPVWLVVAMCISWLVMWLVMFFASVGYYAKLIESQVINPPANRVIHEKRTFYQTKHNQYTHHK
jgi:energy-coupling factor transporter transmembrane protein EcfT